MTQINNEEYAKLIDCGDGVPALILAKENTAPEDTRTAIDAPAKAQKTRAAPKDEETLLPVRTAAVLATIVGQVAIGLGVVLGANPLIAGFAAFAMMATGVVLAFADLIGKQF